MEQLIRNITTSITDQLSGDTSFYTPDELREYEIPEFLIQRVEIEIYRNLNDSIVPPHSEWADMSAREVEQAWEQFIEAIVAEVRMPASFATTVFETAIADVMEMILQPRKAIPEIIFGPQKKLTMQEVEKQISTVTVNSHLAQAVYKYMIRKDINEIEIGNARRIVMKVDERITANYNSLNWAQLLQPLFILAGPKVDTELFRIFFRDRNMDRISRRFDLLNGSLNKIEFIETLSSPDLLNEEGYEDDQVSLFDVQQENEPDSGSRDNSASGPKTDVNKPTPKDSERYQDSSTADSAEKTGSEPKQKVDSDTVPAEGNDLVESDNTGESNPDQDDDNEENDDSLLSSYQTETYQPEFNEEEPDGLVDRQRDEAEAEEVDIDEQDGDEPLYSRFDEGFDDQSEVEEETDDRFADRFTSEEEEDTDEEPDSTNEADDTEKLVVDAPETSAVDSEEQVITGLGPDRESDDNNDEDSPIWQAFLGDEDHVKDDDIPEYSEFAELDEETGDEEGASATIKDSYDEDEPLIDLTVKDTDVDSAEHLIGWLKDDEDRFTSHIFSGSEKAYEEALIDLNQLDNWKQASRFIEKEIFARNLIDMYDEEAVDFTDRLQIYFDEYKS